jgi:hypothetical protein
MFKHKRSKEKLREGSRVSDGDSSDGDSSDESNWLILLPLIS